SKEQHEENLRIALEVLHKEKLYAKFKKFTAQGIEVDLVKVEAITNWKALTNAGEVRSFLGLAGYYQRFMEGFSKITGSMMQLTRNGGRIWVPKDEVLRNEILKEAHSTPYTSHPDGGSWESYIPLLEFVYNNSFQATIGMALYEALYGRRCRSPVHWYEVEEKRVLGPEIIERIVEAIDKIRARIKVAQDR
ncbi:uncharacterized protein LOC111386715, partial [Olea europaea var. sylvestris]|uniref:uncharacterized protein LOC111386715 n=1 Tax=Olea europaea var. sylvestris TaxID=158386 RepID=UPI000C1D6628